MLARLERSSTSSGLSRSDTGAAIPGSDGIHIYIIIKEGADAERFLKTLHERCWLAGLGWLMVGASGALLERSIVDRMVGQPGRPVFEGGPVLDPPLVQDKAKRRPVVVEGVVLDTVAVCRPLSIVERSRFKDLKAAEIARAGTGRGKGARALYQGKSPASWPRAPACQRTPRGPSSSASAKACCCRISCCRSMTPTWTAAPSAMCSRTPIVSRARPWRIRWKAWIMATAAPRSCAGPTARRGSTASPMAARSMS